MYYFLYHRFQQCGPESSRLTKIACEIFEVYLVARILYRDCKDWIRDQRDKARNVVMNPLA